MDEIPPAGIARLQERQALGNGTTEDGVLVITGWVAELRRRSGYLLECFRWS